MDPFCVSARDGYDGERAGHWSDGPTSDKHLDKTGSRG